MKLTPAQKASASPLPPFIRELRDAIRGDRKTKSRRVVKLPKSKGLEFRFEGAFVDGPKPFNCGEYLHIPFRCLADGKAGWLQGTTDREFCPYGKPGDICYLREPLFNKNGWAHYADDGKPVFITKRGAMPWRRLNGQPMKRNSIPQIFMPREAARTFVKIAEIRVERLQDVDGSPEDALSEGINKIDHGRSGTYYHAFNTDYSPDNWTSPERAFQELWDSINGKREKGIYAWDKNPWVWVIGFELTTGLKTSRKRF